MTSQKSRRLISNLQTDLCQKICHNMSNYKITTPASLGARRTKEYCPLTLGASAQGLSCHADGEDFLAGVCGGNSFGFGGLWPWLPSLILGIFLGCFFLCQIETDMGDMEVLAKSEVDDHSEDTKGIERGAGGWWLWPIAHIHIYIVGGFPFFKTLLKGP